MKKTGDDGQYGRIGDEAVRAKTGRTWAEWFALLDAAGARDWDHKRIVAFVSEGHGVGPWWQQMVTVGYEQARGLRDKHQTASGYTINRSKTIAAPAAKVFEAWKDARTRKRWLPDGRLTIRTATPNKSLRITWEDGPTNLDVNLYPKGDSKTQVAVEHSKLDSAAEGVRMKLYWGDALARLEALLAK
jgi:uncharacterized protein YndB with AHSA1/START domain